MQLWFRQPRPLLVAAAALLLTLPTLLNGVASANAQSDADPPAASALPSPAATTNDPMPNPGLWGGSGLMTVPTAEILPWHGFHTSLSYFPLNSGLSVTGSVAILKDLEASLVFGVPPANGFSSLAASIKYRIMNQAEGQPISLALGASMLGLGDTLSYVPGSNIYLVLSHGFDWADLRLVNLHGGFMGGISGARLVAGADVPILDFARVELEYLGNFNLLSQAVNLGLVITPIDGLTLQAALLQRPSSFWDRDFVLSVGWRGDWAPLFGLETAASPSPSASPSPAPSAMPSATPTPSLQPPATDKGSVRIRAIDKERIIALETARVSLNQASTGLHFEANTDVTGEVRFERIPIGTYEIRLEKPGWAPETRMISVQTDLETFLEIPLSGQGGTIFGSIEVAGGGTVPDLDLEVIDASHLLVRRLNLDNPNYRLEKLPPGNYTLVVKQADRERLRINILVRANAESQYDLTLPPTGLPSPTVQPTVQPSATAQPSVSPSVQPSGSPSPQPSATASPGASPTPVPTLTPPPLPSPSASASATPTPSPTPTPGPILAQIEGTVKVKGGGPLQGVRLELKNDDLLVITLSTAEGKYVFRDIPKGIFRLQISKDGYKSRAFQIMIAKSETLKHDFELEAGQ